MTTKISKKLVSVNDQIHTSSMIYFDIFYFGPQLLHRQITAKNPSVSINQQLFFTKMKNYSVMVKPLILLKIFLFFPTKN